MLGVGVGGNAESTSTGATGASAVGAAVATGSAVTRTGFLGVLYTGAVVNGR